MSTSRNPEVKERNRYGEGIELTPTTRTVTVVDPDTGRLTVKQVPVPPKQPSK